MNGSLSDNQSVIVFLLWFLACLAIDLLALGILMESKRPGTTPAIGMVIVLVASLVFSLGFAVLIRPHTGRQAISCLFLGCFSLALLAELVLF